jgi:predicted transport protein
LADIRLFQLQFDAVRELRAESVDIEKSLQSLMEQHLDSFLGVRFLATEYVTGKAHGGRIDTLGLDDNNCPVIIEYKRALNENVISQGLFYLDWLMDHQGEFTLQVLKKLGPEWADKIDWSGPRLLCIAGDFTRYDEYAVLQIPRNIELLRYRRYGGDLLLLELVRASNTVPNQRRSHAGEVGKEKQFSAGTAEAGVEPKAVQDVWEALKAFLLALGDDVQMKELEQYVAFRRLKNFACVKVRTKDLQVWTRLDPSSVPLEEGFTRDVSQLGHAGTGDLEIRIQTAADLERAQPLLLRSYQGA